MYIVHPGFYMYLGFLVWGEDVEMTVDGGCSYRPQFSRGGLGACPPQDFLNLSQLRVVLRHSETALRS